MAISIQTEMQYSSNVYLGWDELEVSTSLRTKTNLILRSCYLPRLALVFVSNTVVFQGLGVKCSGIVYPIEETITATVENH